MHLRKFTAPSLSAVAMRMNVYRGLDCPAPSDLIANTVGLSVQTPFQSVASTHLKRDLYVVCTTTVSVNLPAVTSIQNTTSTFNPDLFVVCTTTVSVSLPAVTSIQSSTSTLAASSVLPSSPALPQVRLILIKMRFCYVMCACAICLCLVLYAFACAACHPCKSAPPLFITLC